MAINLETFFSNTIDHLRTQLQETGIVRVEPFNINLVGADDLQVNLSSVRPINPTFNGYTAVTARIDLLSRIQDPRSSNKAIELVERGIRVLTRYEPIPGYGSLRFVGADNRQYEGGLSVYVATFESIVPVFGE